MNTPRIWSLVFGVALLSACQALSSSLAGVTPTPTSEYPIQITIAEIPSTSSPDTATRTISGSVHGWFPCTNGASIVPPFVWLTAKDGDLEYKDYQVREFIFEDVPPGDYNLNVGCYMVTPVYAYEINIGRADLMVEIELPFETAQQVYDVFGCLDCPVTPTPSP
ncbi:MAG: hypothetical protein PVF83_09015 [Anaerolineales bacterium]|jgi:hypothetical protein